MRIKAEKKNVLVLQIDIWKRCAVIYDLTQPDHSVSDPASKAFVGLPSKL